MSSAVAAAPRRGRGKSARSIELIEASYRILEEIHPATVRAVCYRLFTEGLIESMSKNNTNKVGNQLTYAREHGRIPWSWVVDETRAAKKWNVFEDPEEYRRAVNDSYRIDRWLTQRRRVEVWSEKGTIRGTLWPVLSQYTVPFRVNHGYASATMVNDVADETADAQIEGRPKLLVFYVGDWDCSGLHMSEVDLPDRLEEYGAHVELRRIALTAEDVSDPALPSFGVETKRGDPRYPWFVQHYGARCWELDAMSPVVLRERVEKHILDAIDPVPWNRCNLVEKAEQESLRAVMATWRPASISRQASK